MRRRQTIFYLLFISISALLFYQFNSNKCSAIYSEASTVSVSGCGTISPYYNYSGNLDPDQGKNLFKENCATCHAKNMRSEMTGPALGGTFQSWNQDTSAYLKYIQNSKLYFESNDNKRLNEVRNYFNALNTHQFYNLTLEEIKNILLYIELQN